MTESQQRKSLAVSASFDQSIRVWDFAEGTHLHSIPHADSQVNSMCMTFDGCQLAVAGYQKIKMYDMVTFGQTPVISFEAVQKNVTTIGFQHDGRFMFTGGEDQSCRVYDMRGQQLMCQRIFEIRSCVNSVVIHPINESQLFIADSAGSVYVWDLRTNQHEILSTRCFGSEYIVKLSMHPTGRTLAGITSTGRLMQWDLPNSEVVEWGQNNGVPHTEMANPDDMGLPREPVPVYQGHGLSCRYTPDGFSLVTTSSVPNITVFDYNAEPKSPPRLSIPLRKCSTWNWDSAFTNDSKYVLTGGADCSLLVHSLEDGSHKMSFDGHSKPITALCAFDLP